MPILGFRTTEGTLSKQPTHDHMVHTQNTRGLGDTKQFFSRPLGLHCLLPALDAQIDDICRDISLSGSETSNNPRTEDQCHAKYN
jgi:hypothetical protein